DPRLEGCRRSGNDSEDQTCAGFRAEGGGFAWHPLTPRGDREDIGDGERLEDDGGAPGGGGELDGGPRVVVHDAHGLLVVTQPPHLRQDELTEDGGVERVPPSRAVRRHGLGELQRVRAAEKMRAAPGGPQEGRVFSGG